MKTETDSHLKLAGHVIECLGGNKEVAKMFAITSEAVSAWRKRGIPKQIERHLRVVRADLFKPKKGD